MNIRLSLPREPLNTLSNQKEPRYPKHEQGTVTIAPCCRRVVLVSWISTGLHNLNGNVSPVYNSDKQIERALLGCATRGFSSLVKVLHSPL